MDADTVEPLLRPARYKFLAEVICRSPNGPDPYRIGEEIAVVKLGSVLNTTPPVPVEGALEPVPPFATGKIPGKVGFSQDKIPAAPEVVSICPAVPEFGGKVSVTGAVMT